MVDYGDFHFACAPRVGVSWFVKACQLSGLGPAFLRDPEPHDGTFRVSLIRNPVRWLESVYAARAVGWNSVHLGKFAQLDARESLESFVWQYLHDVPGEIGRIMLSFEADSIIRIEDMPWAFIELATALGIDSKFFPAIESMGPTNAGLSVKRMPKVLERRVINAERKMCHEFGYL